MGDREPPLSAPEPIPGRHPVSAMASNPANMRFARHRELLARWPILDEAWARAIKRNRITSVDRTPGPATFGR